MREFIGWSAVSVALTTAFFLIPDKPAFDVVTHRNQPACLAGLAETGPGTYSVDLLQGNVITRVQTKNPARFADRHPTCL